MSSLCTLTDVFLLENKTLPDRREAYKEEVAEWVEKSGTLNICTPNPGEAGLELTAAVPRNNWPPQWGKKWPRMRTGSPMRR